MSAVEIIEHIKELPPAEREQVARFVTDGARSSASRKFSVGLADDGLPVIHVNGGSMTSQLVRELEAMSS